MEIIKLTPKDWKNLKDLRLEALKEESDAFGSSYEESAAHSDDEWKQKLANPKNPTILVCDEGQAIGMAGAYQEKGVNLKHIAYIWGVYLRKNYRGKGISLKLMEALLNEIAKNKEIEKINLNVNTSRLSAVKLYEKLGFEIVGTLHKEMKVNGKYIDEHVMEKFLS
jgi:RimJ/RimL family protein N-acetyltransferase